MRIYYMDTNSKGTKEPWEEITDLYFFEEQMIHNFRGTDVYDNHYVYKFVIQPGDNIEMEMQVKIA